MKVMLFLVESELVRMRGLEPPRLTAPAPKTGVSTNSTTSACLFGNCPILHILLANYYCYAIR